MTLADSRDVAFDTLVFATGTCARRLPLPGLDRDGVFSLRAIGDVQRLRPAFDRAQRIAILGGGYIELETAAVMRGENRHVIVPRSRRSRAQARHRTVDRQASSTASTASAASRSALGARVAAIDADGGAPRCCGSPTATEVKADAVLLAAGAKANDELAGSRGPCLPRRHSVDAVGRTGAGNVYASATARAFRRALWPAPSPGMRAERHRPGQARGRGDGRPAGDLQRCRGSGPTNTTSSCRSPACSTATTPPPKSATPQAERFSVEYRRGGRLDPGRFRQRRPHPYAGAAAHRRRNKCGRPGRNRRRLEPI